jgi:hypothetical protein
MENSPVKFATLKSRGGYTFLTNFIKAASGDGGDALTILFSLMLD